MIATLDRLYALREKLDQARERFDGFDAEHGTLLPVELNEILLMRRLISDYIEESEEALALGQLQNYYDDRQL